MTISRRHFEAVLDEEAAMNEQFKRVLNNWRQFRAEPRRWFSFLDVPTEMAVYVPATP